MSILKLHEKFLQETLAFLSSCSLFTGNNSTRADKMCHRHFWYVTSCIEYVLLLSIVNRPVKPLQYRGINKNSEGKMHEISLSCFFTLLGEKVLAYLSPIAGVISILLLTSKVRINFLFSILLPMKNELNKWN